MFSDIPMAISHSELDENQMYRTLRDDVITRFEELTNSFTRIKDFVNSDAVNCQKKYENTMEQLLPLLNTEYDKLFDKYSIELNANNIAKMTTEMIGIKKKFIELYEKTCDFLIGEFKKNDLVLKQKKTCVIKYQSREPNPYDYPRPSTYEKWLEFHNIENIAVKNFMSDLLVKGYIVLRKYENKATYDDDCRSYFNNEFIEITIST